jgi:diguanylate cyclase (GGDEF)-like protein
MKRQQRAGGSAWLRFKEPLESDFRETYLAEHITLMRAALVVGFLFALAMLALDYWLIDPGFTGWSVPFRAVITQSFVIVMIAASFFPAAQASLSRLGIAIGLCIAATFLLTSVFAPAESLNSSFSGYVVVTFYVYFFLAQLFWRALLTAMALFASFLAVTALQTDLTDMVIYGTYLLFVNLISAIFLYSYEAASRKQFLKARALNELARRDPLTELVNRKGLDEQLDALWAHAKREGEPLALALIDIDHFKAYNDHYGHQAGDRCLVAVAEVVGQAARRPLDLAARFGGEEFVLLLPGPSLENAEKITENLRRQIVALNLPHQASPTAKHVTVSAGLVHIYPQKSDRSIQGFIQLADQAMYEAKQRGRNRVSIAGVEQDESMLTGLFESNQTINRSKK